MAAGILDLPELVLALIVCKLSVTGLRDRVALARTCSSLRTASRSSLWWPDTLRVGPRTLANFAEWMRARTPLGTRCLRVRLVKEDLADFTALMNAIVSAMPRLDKLVITASRSTPSLSIGALKDHPSLRCLVIRCEGAVVPFMRLRCIIPDLRPPATLERLCLHEVLSSLLYLHTDAPRLAHLELWEYGCGPPSIDISRLAALTSLHIIDTDMPAAMASTSVQRLWLYDSDDDNDESFVMGRKASLLNFPNVHDLTVFGQLKFENADELAAAARQLRSLRMISCDTRAPWLSQLTNLTSLHMDNWLPRVGTFAPPSSLVDLRIATSHQFPNIYHNLELSLTHCTRLERLSLESIRIKSTLLDGVQPSLRHLDLHDCRIVMKGPHITLPTAKLVHVSLTECVLVRVLSAPPNPRLLVPVPKTRQSRAMDADDLPPLPVEAMVHVRNADANPNLTVIESYLNEMDPGAWE